MAQPNSNDNSYAVQKVLAIRAQNASIHATGMDAYNLQRAQDEIPRVQKMNRDLCTARRPERDLANSKNFDSTTPSPIGEVQGRADNGDVIDAFGPDYEGPKR